MKKVLFKRLLLALILAAGCTERPHTPQPETSKTQPPPTIQDSVPESHYVNILYHLKGTKESGYQYQVVSTRVEQVGRAQDGSPTMGRFFIAIGANHRYEAKFVESDISEVSNGVYAWSTEREKNLSGTWTLTQNSMILSGFGEVLADTKNERHFFEIKVTHDFPSSQVLGRSYVLYTDTRPNPLFEDLKP